MQIKKPIHLSAAIVAVICFSSAAGAGTILTGVATSDGDVFSFGINVTAPGNFTAASLGYGGSISPAISVGGFATSLSLYETNDVFQSQIASDFFGGTATGATCSNGATQDPTTHLCEDAMITSFPLNVGTYVLTLSGQWNNGPGNLDYTQFPVAPGTNFNGGPPFLDPGPPGAVFRNGNWAVTLDFTGTDIITSGVPEPSTFLLGGLGFASLLAIARARRTSLNPALVRRGR